MTSGARGSTLREWRRGDQSDIPTSASKRAAMSSVPDPGQRATPGSVSPPRISGTWRRLKTWHARWFPPARYTWVAVLGVGAYGLDRLGPTVALLPLVVFPLVAAGGDLLFQAVRFDGFRVPDASLATGALLAVLLPPTVIVAEGSVVVFAAVALRHILRSRGRPWFNAAALGTVMGAVLFGMAPAWWVAIGSTGEYVMLAAGIAVTLRSWRNWRLPVSFLVAYGGLATLYHFVFGGAISPSILLLSVLDPTALFFALFMVPEPKTAPAEAGAQPLYAAAVAVLAVFSPLIFPTLGLLVGLLVGNLLSIWLRRRHALHSAARATGIPRRSERTAGAGAAARKTAARWSVGRRVAAGLFVLVLLGVAAGASVGPSNTPSLVVSAPPAATGTGGGGTNTAACSTDTPSVASSTLSLLHAELGPSVILSYDANTGVVVFYDPVNLVTVTETDLYEDHGFAEFNGDDFTVNGCAP